MAENRGRGMRPELEEASKRQGEYSVQSITNRGLDEVEMFEKEGAAVLYVGER